MYDRGKRSIHDVFLKHYKKLKIKRILWEMGGK